jgi:hypothetical protein
MSIKRMQPTRLGVAVAARGSLHRRTRRATLRPQVTHTLYGQGFQHPIFSLDKRYPGR